MKWWFVALCVVSRVAWSASAVVPSLPPLPGGPGLASPLPGVAQAVPLGPLSMPKGSSFDLRFVNVGQLVDLLYGDALKVPHVISSEVLNDQRVVSFQFDTKKGDLRAFVKVFLESQGYEVTTKDGVDFIDKKPPAERVDPDRAVFVYHPRFRTAAYLSKVVTPLLAGRGSVMAQPSDLAASTALGGSAGAAVPAGASGASVGLPAQPVVPKGLADGVEVADDLVFSGSAEEVRDLRKLLPQLDTAPGEVVVRGWVYEVSDTSSGNSAFSIAAHVLDGQLGISNGSTGVDSNALTFDAHFLNLAISALSADTRFHEVSDPHALVVSGEKVSLNVGEQVPTLGSVSYQGATGTPVQSVDYQSAGVIFNVQPTVLGDVVRVELDEEISSFVPTTSGVNGSPTKNTRQLATTVSLKDGQVVVLGGLVQDSDTAARTHEGWLPHFLDGKSSSKGRTEVLLVLQVQRVGDPAQKL